MGKRFPVGIVMTQIKQLQARILERMIKEYPMEECDLNSAQMHIMFHLWLEDDITISQLGKKAQLANTTLTTMLDRLEGLGVVVRKPNPDNRREIKICLTDRGRAQKHVFDDITKTMRSINFAGFTDEETEQFEGYLERFRDNLIRYEQERK